MSLSSYYHTTTNYRLSRLLRVVLPPLILAAAIAGFAALRASRPALPPVPVTEKAWRVDVLEITPGRHTPQVLLYGTVEAPRQAGLSTAVAADVAAVPVSEGQSVAAGTLLVNLDDRDIGLLLRQRIADVAEIQAQIDCEHRRHQSDWEALEREQAMLALTRKAVERAEDLNRRRLGSDSAVDEARQQLERETLIVTTRRLTVEDHAARLAQLQAKLARAQALRDQARLDQERTRITAPFAGRVAKVAVAPGDRVKVGDPLVQLYADGDLEIRAQIPFRHLPAVRVALDTRQPLVATAQVDGRPLHAELVRLGGEVARSGGGVDALFRIREGAAGMVPGRLLSLVLALPPEDGTVEIPFDALYGLDRVYRLDGERMTAVTVERIGERRDADGRAQVLVRSPEIKAGDRIIVTQLPNAVTGLKVSIAGTRP